MLEIKNITYTYAQHLPPAVVDFSLTVNVGEFVAIVGKSGSGKSTLAKHLNALLLPQTGTVLIDGNDTATAKNHAAIRAQVGMLWQNPEQQFVAETVAADVAFAPENFGLPPAEIRARVAKVLAALNLTEFADVDPYLLSGGQQQRAALAGILVMQPRYLVLDEPVAALDPHASAEIFAHLQDLQQQHACTIIMITHSLDDALRYAQRLVVMNAGKLHLDKAVKDIIAEPETLAATGFTLPFALQFKPRPPCENLVALEKYLLARAQ